MAEEDGLRCAAHPNRETQLRCSKCGIPICPDCAIETPVGHRCKSCAQLRKSLIYDVSPVEYLKAISAGLVVAAAGGVVLLGIVRLFVVLLASLLGLAVGESVSRAANYKRGTALQVVAGICAGLGVAIGQLWPAIPTLVAPGLPAQLKMDIIVQSLAGNIWVLLLFVLAIVVAVSRIR